MHRLHRWSGAGCIPTLERGNEWKKNEEREYGEYRTQRLVLEAWDRLEKGEFLLCLTD
ncbi:hypothetical protein [Candidatus Symbiobacter mobilis]|uniref:Uncharacterized protein n=1 Tax=Candidatus Symbiobacter mobilis CR TaxID=946483 RepID=U5NAT2_9BURK|nr:hypothetical protein [Candidatus Symbiobacter mobilis]AGX87333.1 hypothetical protein Cenrod_1241 [Candidatus Symbiobacter mobilis CR]